ncbi:inorganic phosphate transporter [Edaphocola flava]|uniref:inorganic phosphate transporter n=1 Tax=Edaphocola flava TaxID=2499629 RepID=UPI00100C03B8|nr:inorganic phosphate transporter [Edaphocola flava]
MFTLLIVIIALALIFDYINGFHDAANAIATVVSTKVLTPLQAVVWAAFFNFAAYFIFDHGVANTIAKTVKTEYITLAVILAGLIAAIAWNLITWWFGIPSSSSHTLIGGFGGAAIAHALLSSSGATGLGAIDGPTIIKIISFIVLAPFMGMLVAFIISLWFLHSFKKGAWPKVISVSIIILSLYSMSRVLETPKATMYNSQVKIEETTAKITALNLTTDQKVKEIADETLRKEAEPLFKDLKEAKKKAEAAQKSIDSQKPYILKLLLFGHNMKWALLFFILMSMSIFTLFLSSLNYAQSERWFKRMQLVSSAAFSIGHGGNDSQKVMGIIMAAYIAYDPTKYNLDHMVAWVPLACYTAIALGTMSGGWKIIKTMGTKITKVTPFEGVAAETAGALTLFITEMLKIPVSTTHTITGSIIGVGATKRLSAVRWGVTISLLWAWIITIPISALFAGAVYLILSAFGLK